MSVLSTITMPGAVSAVAQGPNVFILVNDGSARYSIYRSEVGDAAPVPVQSNIIVPLPGPEESLRRIHAKQQGSGKPTNFLVVSSNGSVRNITWDGEVSSLRDAAASERLLASEGGDEVVVVTNVSTVVVDVTGVQSLQHDQPCIRAGVVLANGHDGIADIALLESDGVTVRSGTLRRHDGFQSTVTTIPKRASVHSVLPVAPLQTSRRVTVGTSEGLAVYCTRFAGVVSPPLVGNTVGVIIAGSGCRYVLFANAQDRITVDLAVLEGADVTQASTLKMLLSQRLTNNSAHEVPEKKSTKASDAHVKTAYKAVLEGIKAGDDGRVQQALEGLGEALRSFRPVAGQKPSPYLIKARTLCTLLQQEAQEGALLLGTLEALGDGRRARRHIDSSDLTPAPLRPVIT
jgi:hypothetical protein